MADYAEKLAKHEASIDTIKVNLTDHELRMRKLERLIYGVIGAALVLSWVVTQAINTAKVLT